MRLILLLALLLSLPICIAVDLSEFPEMFIKEGKVNTVIILGKSADVEDVIGATDIIVALQQNARYRQDAEIAKLDNEVKVLSAQNSIIIGGPCANSAAAKIMGYPKNCMEGFEAGKGIVKLYEFENGNIAMLVAGALSMDTRRTAKIVANYEKYNLTGTKMTVTGLILKELVVNPSK